MNRTLCLLAALLLLTSLCACGKAPLPEPEILPTTATTVAGMEAEEETTIEDVVQKELPYEELEAMLTAPARDFNEVIERFYANASSLGQFYTTYEEFSFFDMDGDSWPELFIKFGTCQADVQRYVFTSGQNKATFIGTISGRGTLVGCGKGGIYRYDAQSGTAWIEWITKQGNKLRITNVVTTTDLDETDYTPDRTIYIPDFTMDDFDLFSYYSF